MLIDIKGITGLTNCKYLLDEPLAKYTTWKVGGKADILFLPESTESCLKVLHALYDRGTPYFVLGNGSNILIGDKGFRGAVVKLAGLNNMDFTENIVTVGCGAMLPVLAVEAAKRHFSGLEFIAGIPGTVGAALKINAGADGENISDVFHSAIVWQDGLQKEVFAEDMQYSYRQSAFKNASAVFLMAKFSLAYGEQEKIKHKMQQNISARKSKQPLEYPNAGSVFKNPVGSFAGKLIADAGLQGRSIGGATVSLKHANFIVNTGHATAEDTKKLILLVQQEVASYSGITLEPEVEFIGEF